MKRCVLSLVFALGLVLASFGIDFSLSAGGGGLLGMDITRYTLTAAGDGNIPGWDIKVDLTQEFTQFNYGGFLFFDATFAELAVTIQGGSNTYSEIRNVTKNIGGASPPDKNEGVGAETSLNFSLLGKYPFVLNEKFSIFPLLGIEYRVVLMAWRQSEGRNKHYRDEGYGPEDQDKNGNPHTLAAWNSFWFDLGVGLDYALTPNLYLRGEFLYGFRLETIYEKDAVDKVKQELNDSDPSLKGLTSGPTLKIALGYKFFHWKKK